MDTLEDANLINPTLERDLDACASAHADANRVEEAWFLRGVSDALAGLPPGDETHGVYRRQYTAGYLCITKGRSQAGL